MLRESWHQDKAFNSGARRGGGGGGGEGWDSRYSTEFSAGFSGREPPPFSRSVSDSLGSGERGDMVYANRGWPPTRRASSDDCYGGRSSSSPSGYPRGAAGGTAAAGGGAVSAGMGAPAGPGSGRRHSGASSHPVYPAAEAYMRGPPRSGYYHGAAPGSAEGGYDAAGYGDFWGGYRDRGYHNHYNHQDYLYSSKYEYSSFHTSTGLALEVAVAERGHLRNTPPGLLLYQLQLLLMRTLLDTAAAGAELEAEGATPSVTLTPAILLPEAVLILVTDSGGLGALEEAEEGDSEVMGLAGVSSVDLLTISNPL